MSSGASPPLVCPFCGAELTDRLSIEGSSFLVFRCLFTPRVDAGQSDAELAERLKQEYGGASATYFRGMCDRLHLYVTKGEGAHLLAPPSPET